MSSQTCACFTAARDALALSPTHTLKYRYFSRYQWASKRALVPVTKKQSSTIYQQGPPQSRLRCLLEVIPPYLFFIPSLRTRNLLFRSLTLQLLDLLRITLLHSPEISGVVHSGRSDTPTYALCSDPGTRIPCFQTT
jgi:hypothetical protein